MGHLGLMALWLITQGWGSMGFRVGGPEFKVHPTASAVCRRYRPKPKTSRRYTNRQVWACSVLGLQAFAVQVVWCVCFLNNPDEV